MCSDSPRDHSFLENLLSVEEAWKFFDTSMCNIMGEYQNATARTSMAVRCARALYLADATNVHRCASDDRLADSQSRRAICSIQSDSPFVAASHPDHVITTATYVRSVKQQNVTTRTFVSHWFSQFYERQLSYYNHTIAQYHRHENKEDNRPPALRTIFNEALVRNGFETDALLSIYQQSSRGCPEHKKVDTIRLQLERDEGSLKPICGAEFNYQSDDGASHPAQQNLAYEGARKKWKPCLQPN